MFIVEADGLDRKQRLMATSATTPKASHSTSPPRAMLVPIINWSMNVAVMGPEATPPESNAMAV